MRGKEKGPEYLFDLDVTVQRRADQASTDAAAKDAPEEDEEEEAQQEFVIDAKHVGGAARFINHCCGPNLIVQNVLAGHSDERLTRVGFFASQVRTQEIYQSLACIYSKRSINRWHVYTPDW